MINQEKTKEELILRIQELEHKYNSLEKLYEKDVIDLKKAKQDLTIVNKELTFQIKEKEKREEELIISTQILEFQNKEREKRAAELLIANKELAFQNEEKEKRAIELIEVKEHAEECDRLKSAFLANMSHEIRTPMNGILGFAEILKEPNIKGEDRNEYISIIAKSGVRMLNIINDIMSISKIESGQVEISVSETNVNEQMEFIYNFFKPEAEKKRIQISFKNSLPETDAIIKIDCEKVTAILTNLVNNAIKFTKSGSIEFGCEKKGKYLEFFVKDTGSGIPQEKKQLIFERFRQGSESITRNYEGAGLGLSISKAYVEILGGEIWLDSEVEKGSVFYFSIPYNTEPHENIFNKNLALDTMKVDQIKNLKILIAEDDEVSQKVLTLIVKNFCQKIFKAQTGVEAVKICRNNPDINLVLMDIKMHEMNGFDATKEIRQFNNDVIIVAQTAYGYSGEKERALSSGFNDYILKPVIKDELTSIINRHFNNYKNT